MSGSDAGIQVIEVGDAAYLFGDLFRRSFACEIADFPRHYVAFDHRGGQDFAAVGYIHKTERDGYSLLGGLCVDPAVMRGGIGSALMRAAIADSDAKATGAIFAYTRHPVSLAVSLKVGMLETEHEGLLVTWLGARDKQVREDLLRAAAEEIPF